MTKPLQEIAYAYLKAKIEDGTMQPGQIYSETRMAKELNISRTPFKDALVRLSQDKYIDILPSKGFRLHTITEEDIGDTFQVRCAVEGYCALQLMERQHTSSGRLTLRQLASLMDKMDLLLDKPEEVTAFVELDTQFHAQLIDFAGSREFSKLFSSYVHQIATLAVESLAEPHRIQDTFHEHQAILDAIVDEDPLACYKAVEQHMVSSRDINLKQMKNRE